MNSFLLIATQFENLGDLIINKMLADELSRYGNVYIDFGGAPSNFCASFIENKRCNNISAEKILFSKGVLAYIRRFLLFQKHKICVNTVCAGPIYPISKERFLKSVVLNIIDFINNIFGVKNVRIGNCCSHLIIDKISFKDKRVDAYYLRSKESVEYLKQYVSEEKVSYIPDLCFLLKYQVEAKPKKKKVLLDFRHSKDTALYDWCKKTVSSIVSQGFEVIIYYQVEKDKPIAEHLYDLLKMPGVKLRENIVWYKDLDFYADKMFVISNRLHSLLIGAAYEAYPICVYEEKALTSKLKHVFNSAFSSDLPILFNMNGNPPSIDFCDFYNSNIGKMKLEYMHNAKVCRETICAIMQEV